jgi:transcriptional regulator with XRE-family HTH domain
MTTKTKPSPSPIETWRSRNPIMTWVQQTEQPYGWMGRLAAELGVTRQAIYRWLIGETSPQAEHLDALSKLTKSIVNYEDWRRWLSKKPA